MLRRPFFFALALVAAICLGLPAARADDASKRAKVEQLFVLTHVDSMMDQMVTQVSASMKTSSRQQMSKLNLTASQQIAADKFTARVDALIKQSLSMDTLKPVFLKVYMDTYTDEELDGIIAFYKSPPGQAFLAKTPQLMQRSFQLMQQQVATLQPQLEDAQKEFTQDLAKSSPKP